MLARFGGGDSDQGMPVRGAVGRVFSFL
jgi:hypothetical protein